MSLNSTVRLISVKNQVIICIYASKPQNSDDEAPSGLGDVTSSATSFAASSN